MQNRSTENVFEMRTEGENLIFAGGTVINGKLRFMMTSFATNDEELRRALNVNGPIRHEINSEWRLKLTDEGTGRCILDDEYSGGRYAMIVLLVTDVEDAVLYLSDKNATLRKFPKWRDPKSGKLEVFGKNSISVKEYRFMADIIDDFYDKRWAIVPYRMEGMQVEGMG